VERKKGVIDSITPFIFLGSTLAYRSPVTDHFRTGVFKLPVIARLPRATMIDFEPSSALMRPDSSPFCPTSTLPDARIGPEESWSWR
jgi:hypothetical protein